MKLLSDTDWPSTEKEALSLQKQLAVTVIREDAFRPIRYVCGVDVAYNSKHNLMVASAVVIDADTCECVDNTVHRGEISFPYIPGLFSFREAPALAPALQKLVTEPDLIICDGHGLAHPRRFGLACHIGVLFDIPAIGCAKTLLIGQYEQPSNIRGASSQIMENSEVIGAALRTQQNVKPVFVSTGHRVSLQTACDLVLKISPKYRLPETTRLADQEVKKAAGELTKSNN